LATSDDTGRWELLGKLLEARRGELGYKFRPAFERDRRINVRLAGDIEKAYRTNYARATLAEIAASYAVTLGSMLAVVHGESDRLIPVDAGAPIPVVGAVPERTAPQDNRPLGTKFLGNPIPARYVDDANADPVPRDRWEQVIWETEDPDVSLKARIMLVAWHRWGLAEQRAGYGGAANEGE
jgi:hypothetical protein